MLSAIFRWPTNSAKLRGRSAASRRDPRDRAGLGRHDPPRATPSRRPARPVLRRRVSCAPCLSPPQRRPAPRAPGRRPGAAASIVVEQRFDLDRLVAELHQRAVDVAQRPARNAAPAAAGRRRLPDVALALDTSRIFSRSSSASRSAILRPTPLTCVSRPTSPVAIARTNSARSMPARIASATRGPTPCTLSQRLEQVAFAGVGEAVQAQRLVVDEVAVDEQLISPPAAAAHAAVAALTNT